MATLEVLGAGRVSEITGQQPEVNFDIVLFFFFCTSVGHFAGCSTAGSITEAYIPRIVYVICLPFAVQPVLPLLLGFLPEEKVVGRWRLRERAYSHKDILAMTMIVTAAMLEIIAITMSGKLKSMVPSSLVLIPVLISAAVGACRARWLSTTRSFCFLVRAM